MRVTTQHIARSVAQTIESELLPEAAPGWPASYLRSALMLLTYLEDLATLGPEFLTTDDRELRALLGVGARAFDSPGADPALAARLRDAGAGEEDAAAHEARRAALCEMIVAVYRRSGAERSPELQQVRDGIAEYRTRSQAREDAVWRRAEGLPVM